jgi:hypothetical protein
VLLFRSSLALLFAALASFLTGCACNTPPYHYVYIPGKTATVSGGQATAPSRAPARVRRAIDAGNEIANRPYSMGGGHSGLYANAYDCSGATSYVLRKAGLLRTTNTSAGFRHYDARGYGDWISIYARRGHVFLVVAGLRFDTSYHGGGSGPRWTTASRPCKGFVVRHPPGY